MVEFETDVLGFPTTPNALNMQTRRSFLSKEAYSENNMILDKLRKFVQGLEDRDLLGQIAGLIIYGSAAVNDISSRSDLDTLIVLKDLPDVVMSKARNDMARFQKANDSLPVARSRAERVVKWLSPRIGFYPQIQPVISKTDLSHGRYQQLKTGDFFTKKLFPIRLTFASIVNQPIVLGNIEMPEVDMDKSTLVRELFKSALIYGYLSLMAPALSHVSPWGDIGSYEFSKLSLKNCFFALNTRNGTFAEIKKEFGPLLSVQFWKEFSRVRESEWEEDRRSKLVSLAPRVILRIHNHTISTILGNS